MCGAGSSIIASTAGYATNSLDCKQKWRVITHLYTCVYITVMTNVNRKMKLFPSLFVSVYAFHSSSYKQVVKDGLIIIRRRPGCFTCLCFNL